MRGLRSFRLLTAATALAATTLVGCQRGDTLYVGTQSPESDDEICSQTPSVPEPSAGLSNFYRKSLNVRGVRVLGSANVSDVALSKACSMVSHMQPLNGAIWDAMVRRGMRAAVIARDEKLTQIPEYADLYSVFPNRDWDALRGVGATLDRPVSSVGEENLLCDRNTPFTGEFILPQTFSHGLRALGIAPSVADFNRRLEDAYERALAAGLWADTFAAANAAQYFAEGVQDWFDANSEAAPADGVHNQVNTRAELKTYDSTLAGMIGDYLADDAWRPSCP